MPGGIVSKSSSDPRAQDMQSISAATFLARKTSPPSRLRQKDLCSKIRDPLHIRPFGIFSLGGGDGLFSAEGLIQQNGLSHETCEPYHGEKQWEISAEFLRSCVLFGVAPDSLSRLGTGRETSGPEW